MTDEHLHHFDDLDAWDADDYETADAAVDSITNDIVFRPPEPPPPPAAIVAWWNARINQRRLAPSDVRSLSYHIARHLAHALLVRLIRPNANNQRTWDAIYEVTEEITEQMINHAPEDLDQLELQITDADDPNPHPIAKHLNECLNQIVALSPTDVRLSVDVIDAWRDTLE